MGSSLPTFATNSTSYNSSIPWQNQTIFWDAIPAALAASEGWDGFALLVDDVERYVGTALNYSLAALQEGLPHFFRLAVSPLLIALSAVYQVTHHLLPLFSTPMLDSPVTLPWLRPFGRTEHG